MVDECQSLEWYVAKCKLSVNDSNIHTWKGFVHVESHSGLLGICINSKKGNVLPDMTLATLSLEVR